MPLIPLHTSTTATALPPAPRRPWVLGLLAALLVSLLLGGTYYWRHHVQLSRYARRAWATLTKNGLTGREKTPLLAGYSVHGIDVSAYQGRIDWPEVARNKVRFAFIKASEGATLRDARFARNWREARKAGVLCGAYHYFQPNRNGKIQAELFARTVPLAPGDLPPVLDVEAAHFHDVAVLRREVSRWLRLIETHYGVRPILYSNHSFYQRHLAGHFDQYPLWLAHYEVERPTLPRSKWIIWQHSDEAYVPGIRGVVDFNVFQGSFAALQALQVPAAAAPPAKTTTPRPGTAPPENPFGSLHHWFPPGGLTPESPPMSVLLRYFHHISMGRQALLCALNRTSMPPRSS